MHYDHDLNLRLLLGADSCVLMHHDYDLLLDTDALHPGIWVDKQLCSQHRDLDLLFSTDLLRYAWTG